MRIDFRFLGLAGAVSALVGLGQIAACTSDKDLSGAGGAGGSAGGSSGLPGATGGAAGSNVGAGGTTTAAVGTVCAKPILLAKPGIADFDNYPAGASLSTWSFPLGGDATSGIYAGTFGYGDRPNGLPETFTMVAGNNSTNALEIADTASAVYGGGMGIWTSGCLNATKFSGISFWVRGSAPTGQAKFTIRMEETTPATGSKPGTCPGTDTTCVNPSASFTVTDTWNQILIPWASFTGGSAAGTPVKPDGRNIWQIQFDVGLNWVTPDGGSAAVPAPGAYKLDVDTLTFYSSPGGAGGSTGTGGSTTAVGGSTGASGCDTTNGTYTEATTFATATKTTPYSMNAYNFGTTNPTSFTQTTTGPTGLDCSAGCAMMTLSFGAGLLQYGAGSQFVQYFGATATDVKNLLNETVTMKIAVTLTPATGATAPLPVTVGMFAQDTFTSTNGGTDNIWTYDLGTPASLDAASGWHTVTYKVIDAHVPSWAPTRWVCGATLHDIGIVIQNNVAITATNAGTITLYVQSVTVSP
jgi:hypothetical protein